MKPYRNELTAWSARTGIARNATEWWSGVTDLVRRQPEFVLAGALVGGALVALFMRNARDSTAHSGYLAVPRGTGQASFPATNQANQQWDSRRERPNRRRDDEPLRMPSARLGATEDQMEALATPSTHALETGTAGATGTAYELDPKSITGG